MASSLSLGSRRSRWRLQLTPARGAAWLGADALDATGAWQPVLQPCPSSVLTADERLRYANYALLPFSNRIAAGHLRAVQAQARPEPLPPNWPGLAHPIHGVGWLHPWVVDLHAGREASLRLDWPGHASWPWPFVARQRLRLLGERALQLDLSLCNVGRRQMPAGLGWHPAFARRSQLRLALQARSCQQTGSDGLPDGSAGAAPPFLRRGRAEPAESLIGTDNAFDGWTGAAQLQWPALRLDMKADGALSRRLVIYAPADADYICLEPVSHLNNALAQTALTAAAWGQRWLSPGMVLRARLRLTLQDDWPATAQPARPSCLSKP